MRPPSKKPSTTPAIHCTGTLTDIGSLKPHPRNPNRHSAGQINRLAKIIQAQGWRAPIVVSALSGFVIAGHGRLLAAHQLGIKRVPVDVQPFRDEAMELTHLVADNRIAELAELDEMNLAAILTDLGSMKADIELSGFTETEFTEMRDAFKPTEDDQSRLDEKTVKLCPHCQKAI